MKDVDDVYSFCQPSIQSSGPNNRVTLRHEDVRLFCKEAYNLSLIRGCPLFEELESSPSIILNELGKVYTLRYQAFIWMLIRSSLFLLTF